MGVEVAATGGGCAVAEGPVRPLASEPVPLALRVPPRRLLNRMWSRRSRPDSGGAVACAPRSPDVRSESPFRSQHQNSHSSAWPRLGPCKPQHEHRTLTCLSPHARTHARMHTYARTRTHSIWEPNRPGLTRYLPLPKSRARSAAGRGRVWSAHLWTADRVCREPIFMV